MCVGRLKSGTGRLENHDVPASVYHSGSCGAAETPLFFRNKGAVKKLTAPFTDEHDELKALRKNSEGFNGNVYHDAEGFGPL